MQRSAFFCVLCKRTNYSPVLLRSLKKNVMFFAFFYVLKKRMQKNALGLISRQKLKKKPQKNNAFRTEKNAVPNPESLTMLTLCWHSH